MSDFIKLDSGSPLDGQITNAAIERRGNMLAITAEVDGKRVVVDGEAAYVIAVASPVGQRMFWWACHLARLLNEEYGVADGEIKAAYQDPSKDIAPGMTFGHDMQSFVRAAEKLGLLGHRNKKKGGETDGN